MWCRTIRAALTRYSNQLHRAPARTTGPTPAWSWPFGSDRANPNIWGGEQLQGPGRPPGRGQQPHAQNADWCELDWCNCWCEASYPFFFALWAVCVWRDRTGTWLVTGIIPWRTFFCHSASAVHCRRLQLLLRWLWTAPTPKAEELRGLKSVKDTHN